MFKIFYKIFNRIYGYLELAWKVLSMEGDGLITVPRTHGVYFKEHYDTVFGPENVAGNSAFAGVSAGIMGIQFIRYCLDYQADKKRRKSYHLYELIDAYVNYEIDHSHAPSTESRDARKQKLKEEVRKALFDKDALTRLQQQLFPNEGYTEYEVVVDKKKYAIDDPKLAEKNLSYFKRKEQKDGTALYVIKSISLAAKRKEAPKENAEDKQRLLDNNDQPVVGMAPAIGSINGDVKELNWFEKFYTKVKNSTFGNWVSTSWDFIVQFTIYYWLGWFFTYLFTGLDIAYSTLEVSLTFGLPLIVPVFNLFWKAGNGIYDWWQNLGKSKEDANQKLNNKSERDLELQRRQLIAARLLEIHYQQLNKQLDQQAKANGLSLKHVAVEKNNEDEEVAKDTKEGKELPRKASRLQGLWRWTKWWKEILNTRPAKMIMGFLTGAMFGYIMTYFAAWPVQYFLESVFHVAAATAFWPVVIVSLVSAGVGLLMGIKRSTEASIQFKENHNEVINRQEALKECKALKNKNQQLREVVAKHYNELQQINTKDIPTLARQDLRPRIAEERLDKNTQFWETMNIQAKDTFARKTLRAMDAAFVWLFCGFSGSLLIRSLFSGGAVLTFFFPQLALPLFASLGLGMIALWGTYRLVEYLVNKQQAADLQYVKQAKAYSVGLEQENQYLEKLAHNQKDALKIYKTQEATQPQQTQQGKGFDLLDSFRKWMGSQNDSKIMPKREISHAAPAASGSVPNRRNSIVK